jgi:transcriptional regulator with XRE-family HTH domain
MPKTLYTAPHQVLLALMREARLAAGLTQTELASRLGVQQGVISKCESGTRRLDVIELHAWMKALGADFVAFARELDERLEAKTAVAQAAGGRKRGKA